MCCFTTIFSVLLSRIGIIVWWLTDPQRFTQAAATLKPGGLTLPAWAWAVIGFIFLPWTTLAYLYVFPNGVVGFEWAILVIAVLIDLSSHGGSYRHRHHVSRRFRHD